MLYNIFTNIFRYKKIENGTQIFDIKTLLQDIFHNIFFLSEEKDLGIEIREIGV